MIFLSVPAIPAHPLHHLPRWNPIWIPATHPIPDAFDHLIQARLPIHPPACKINQWEPSPEPDRFASTSLFYPTSRLSRLSCLRTQDLPSWMWNDLSCATWLCAYCQIPYSVRRIVSSKLRPVMFLPGLAELFLPAYQLYYVATRLLLQALCCEQLRRCYKFLQSTLLCLSDTIQFMLDALQYSLAKSRVTLLPSAQAHCPLPAMCRLNARWSSFGRWLIVVI